MFFSLDQVHAVRDPRDERTAGRDVSVLAVDDGRVLSAAAYESIGEWAEAGSITLSPERRFIDCQPPAHHLGV
jgi:hypothetical protein